MHAPDFSLPGTTPVGDGMYALAAQRGKPVVLAFYHGDDRPVCARQMRSYQRDLAMLDELGAVLWGLSPQSLESHRAFATHEGLSFPLLVDDDQQVAAAYEVNGKKRVRRATFVIDAEGIVRWRSVSPLGMTYDDVKTIAKVVASAH